MTREEAKGNLIHAIRWNDMPKKEALDVAIKALEQQSCDDAINRKDTLKAMIEQLGIRNEDYLLPAEATLYKVVKNMPPVTPQALEQEPKTGWIPVSERLPNHDEYINNNGLFNVSDGNRSYSEWFDIYDKQMFGEPTITGFRVDHAVIAWMPLPKTYKAESERL